MTTATRDAPAPPPIDIGRVELIPLEDLHDSPLNPRKHFHPAALEELAASLRATGQLEDVLVRPRPAGGFELAAGHRRRRAAQKAGMTHLRAAIREMDDRTFIEALNVSNLQRDDLHPLEEATGFRSLMTTCGYDVPKLAERCGRSTRYVYDRLSLLDLVPAAKKLFEAGEIPTAHAIELARLGKADQERAIGSGEAADHQRITGLFSFDYGQRELGGDPDTARRKPVSLAEFKAWIQRTVRFDPTDKHVPELFPATVAALATAQEDELKVVKVTTDYRVADEAKDPKDRTYGSAHWRRADGEVWSEEGWKKPAKSKRCDHAVMGIVVSGRGRGEAFLVCVNKDKCRVHWPAKAKAKDSGAAAKEQARAEAERARRDEEQKRYLEEQERYRKAAPAVLKALTTAAAAAKLTPTHAIVREIVRNGPKHAKSLEDVIRGAFIANLANALHPTWGRLGDAVRYGKLLGIDVRKLLAQAPAAKTTRA